jgi:hypothetical protein
MQAGRFASLIGITLALAGGLALAAPPEAEPAGPTSLRRPDVAAWARTVGVQVDSFGMPAVIPEGVFFVEKNLRSAPLRPGVAQTFYLKVRFERFAPTQGDKGKPVRSELAELVIKCASPVKISLNDPPKAYGGHALKGGYTGPGDPALWARLAPAGEQEATVAPGSMAAVFVAGACNSRPIIPPSAPPSTSMTIPSGPPARDPYRR